MNCPRCRGAVPPGAQFCPACGNDLRPFLNAPTQATVAQTPAERIKQASVAPGAYYQPPAVVPPQQKKSPLAWIIAGLSVLALIILGLFVMNLLKKTGSETPTQILVKQGQTPPPVLMQNGKTEPVLATTARGPTKMPPDILRWLEHLERIEKLRGTLAQSGLAELMTLAQPAQYGTDLEGLKDLATGDPDANMPATAADKLSGQGTKTRAKWTALKKDFDSLPPPAECQTIADSYTHAFDETGSMISDVMDALEKSKDDTQGALATLYGMKNTSASIDEYGNATDKKVADICDKYTTRKWFSISSDFGNSSILGSLGAH